MESNRVRVICTVVLVFGLAACGPRGGLGRPEPLPAGVVSGPADFMSPELGAANAGPHRGEAEVDVAQLPRDPAALPGTVIRWQQGSGGFAAGPGPAPQLLWPHGNLVITRNDETGQLAGVELTTGEEKWSVPLPLVEYAMSQMPPVERDGVLYVAAGEAVLAIDLAAGRKLWETELPGEPDGPAFVTGGRLIVRTSFRPLRDPSDPTSMPDFDAPADVRLSALDAASGEQLWSETIGEESQIAVSSGFVIVSEWQSNEPSYDELAAGYAEEAAGEVPSEPRASASGPEAEAAEAEVEEPSYWTDLTLRRLSDGARVGEAKRFAGYLGQSIAWGDLLVVPEGVTIDESTQETALAAYKLPSMESAWRLELDTQNLSWFAAGSELFGFGEKTLWRIDLNTGSIQASVELAALLPAPEGWPAEEEWWPSQCIGGMTTAGNSLAYVTRGNCGSKHLVLLDGRTLRPWRVTMGFDDTSGMLLADAGTLVVEIPGGLTVVDLGSAAPSLAESTTVAQRIDAIARTIESGELMLGYPLEAKAKEFLLGGDAVLPAVREALATGRTAEKLFSVMVLKFRPDPDAVPVMVAAFGPPPPSDYYGGGFGEGGPGETEMQLAFLGRLLEALATCGDARATEVLAGVFDGAETWGPGGRLLALQGLAAIGTPEALAKIDAYRAERSRRTEPWQPPVVEGSAGRRFDDAGMFGGGAPEEGTDDATRRQSADGKVTALVAYAVGGTSDLWLLGEASGILVPLFTGVTSTYGLGIVSVEPTADGAKVTVSRVAEGASCAICGMMGEMEGEEGPQATEEVLTFKWAELRADADGDGWTDLLEKRLHTDAQKADTDGDTIADALDAAPRGAGPAAGGACAREEVLRAAFFGDFAFAEGSLPVFVEGPADVNLQYEGYGGPVIWLSNEETEALQEEVGLDGATYFSFEQRMEEGPPGEWHGAGSPLEEVEFSADGTEATINVTEYRGRLNAVGYEVQLRCIEGKWYPLSIDMTWIS